MPIVTLDELKRLATDFASTLRGGEVVTIEGELGAGKTTFVQAVCNALGVKDTVTSPTFAIMNTYSGSALEVVHLDLYRLKSARELAALGLEEHLGQPHTVTFIEWPDAVDQVQWNATHRIQFTCFSETERSIVMTSYGNGGEVSG